jgi:hypothetical protein
MCNGRVKIQILKWLKRLKNVVQNVYHNSYYLIANKHLLQKFIFVFWGYIPMVPVVVYFTVDEWVCLQSNNNLWYTFCTMLFHLSEHFNICILISLLHIYDISNHYCIFLCWVSPWGWPKRAETCRISTCLYVIVSNYSAVVIYMVTCLTARNMYNLTLSLSLFKDVRKQKVKLSRH